jgi:hypothetical protein
MIELAVRFAILSLVWVVIFPRLEMGGEGRRHVEKIGVASFALVQPLRLATRKNGDMDEGERRRKEVK